MNKRVYRISMKTVSILLMLLAVGLLSLPAATAEGLPSSKATFAYNELIALPSCSLGGEGCTGDSGWTTILRQKIKMANQKDLFIGASLQCGIVTDTTVKSQNATSFDSAEARGTVRVRVEITAPDGTFTYADPKTGVDATYPDEGSVGDGIVFCDRIQTLRAKFSGLNCTVNLDPLSPYYRQVTCEDPEELQLIQKTLNANAFNFVAPNLGTGVHTIDVQARTSAKVTTTGDYDSLGNANAFIGAGSVSVETVRMIKGNDGTTLDLQ